MMALGSDGGSMLTTQCRIGLCSAVSDLTVTERPGRDVLTAEADLEVSAVVYQIAGCSLPGRTFVSSCHMR